MPATDSYLRNLKTVHVVFALSSLGLFGVTIWMIAADHDDPWRQAQKTGLKLEAAKLSHEIEKAKGGEYKQKHEELKKKLDSADEHLEERKAEEQKLETAFADANRQFDLAERAAKLQREVIGVARANRDIGVRDEVGEEKIAELQAIFAREEARGAELEIKLQQAEAGRKQAEQALKELTRVKDEADAELARLAADVTRLQKARQMIAPDNWFVRAKRTIMEWPIIDGFNSHIRVKQDWLPNLEIKLGMTSTARFDRCRTCHVNIDRTESGNRPSYPLGQTDSHDVHEWVATGKYPHPFATHPRMDLYVSASSPHSLEKFGCTICHEGQGSGVEFSNAAHYMNDPHQQHEWEEKYGFATNHFWEYPMYPERFRESACIKCHHTMEELGANPKFGVTAPKVTRGYRLIQKYGCFGCHEINGFTAGKSIGPDVRLEPASEEERQRIEADPQLVAGNMRKVGPSLRHVASKTSENFIAYWTEIPRRFRPGTRMPQFFHLANQQDGDARAFQPVELAGIARYLISKSQPLSMMRPPAGYQPDVARGKNLFAEKGCLACHKHRAFPAATDDFGPSLDEVAAKVKSGPEGFLWVYTWIRDPQRYHPRSRMPNLFLEQTSDGDATIDQAADIAAFLLSEVPERPELSVDHNAQPAFDEAALHKLAEVLLTGPKTLSQEQFAGAFGPNGRYPLDPNRKMTGDELALVFPGTVKEDGDTTTFTATFDAANVDPGSAAEVVFVTGLNQGKVYPLASHDAQSGQLTLAEPLFNPARKGDQFVLNGPITADMKLAYIGRKTITRYGCFACHDIPGYESERPIGTPLQDWGRKETARLAPEHILEFLKEHGEPTGGSTHERIEEAVGKARRGEFKSHDEEERELSAAYFYEDLLHHGRAGFFWQKLREPRSYDYQKTETKRYDERLRMPKFPVTEAEIEDIATFVLGLVAESPAASYIYKPDAAAFARIEGERLLRNYNCTGCHIVELPEIEYAPEPGSLTTTKPSPSDHPEAFALLEQINPPQNPDTGKTIEVAVEGEKQQREVVRFHGLVKQRPEPDAPPEERETTYTLWQPLRLGDKLKLPGDPITFLDAQRVGETPARGGNFAELLVEHIQATRSGVTRDQAWQMSPPPLVREGVKVQTPWLYQFLREPERLRQVTVLRMPKFNMSADEAQSLANYFAAVDNAPFPYQIVREREPGYISGRNRQLRPLLNNGRDDYLKAAWKTLNAPLCIKCHSLGGRNFQVSEPKTDIRGPNLEHVANRLQPDWLMLWLYQPKWITPYTSMPPPLAKDKEEYPDLFGGDAGAQTVGIRDALMNYHRLMEREGVTVYNPAETKPAPAEGK